MPDVVLLVHGSPDPRAVFAAESLADAVERAHPGLRVWCAALDHGPSLTDVCTRLVADDTHDAVVVPGFLGTAHHVRVDVPGAVAHAEAATGIRLTVTAPLGAPPSLIDSLDGQLPPGPVVLAVAGTRDPRARADLQAVADAWTARRGTPVVVGHASQARPTVGEALADVENQSGRTASVAALVLFPGVLHDRIAAEAGGRNSTPPIYRSPETAGLIGARVDDAIGMVSALA